MQVRLIPVLNAAGQLVGRISMSGHKAAAILARVESVKQEFREVDGRRVLCWVPVLERTVNDVLRPGLAREEQNLRMFGRRA